MGEDQEVYKHMCKLCNKSFPCGRSLGGHMRSHVINSPDHHQTEKKLSSLINNGGKMITATSTTTNSNSTDAKYGLRENPKKTCKFKVSSHDHDDTFLVHDKLCKECGKGFQSWKALFGHMKCHSDKITTNLQEQESWTTSQSDNDNLAKNHRKKRSSRRIKRYNMVVATATTTSSSFSMNANNNNNNGGGGTSPSVSEMIEQEQEEEIAMCLMMLSRDVNFNYSVGESSDNIDSAFVQANLVKLTKIEGKSSGGEIVRIKKLRKKDLKSSENGVFSEIPRIGSKMKKSETQLGVFLRKSESELDLVEEDEFDDQAELGSRKFGSIKRKSTTNLDLLDQENSHELFNKEFTHPKKSKFECTTCNKSFHSYQALGGHRASHKKFKGCCFDSRAETSIENEQIDHNNEFADKKSVDRYQTSPSKKVVLSKGVHECLICFRIFSSGQALGGHKRSHLLAEAKMNQHSSANIVIQKPIRDFLDLNMPAPVDQEEISSSTTGYKPWWAESNLKHESLVGLISN